MVFVRIRKELFPVFDRLDEIRWEGGVLYVSKRLQVCGRAHIYLHLLLIQPTEVVCLVSRETACTERASSVFSSPV